MVNSIKHFTFPHLFKNILVYINIRYSDKTISDDLTVQLCNNRLLFSGEEGLIVAGVPETTSEFYVGSKEINEKKFIRNAFQEGDAYFNFGDIVYIDENYFIYFRDRIGDTFRYNLVLG